MTPTPTPTPTPCDHCEAPATYMDELEYIHTGQRLCEHHYEQALERQHDARYNDGPEGG